MSITVLNQQRSSSLVRNALYANAIFSTISGFSFIFFTQPFSQFLGWSNLWIMPVVGTGLLGFAYTVYSIAKSEAIDSSKVKSIIFADLTWVLLSILIIVTPIFPLTPGGKWAAGILADIVATFALLQYLGLRRHVS